MRTASGLPALRQAVAGKHDHTVHADGCEHADRGAAEALNVQEGTPLLSVERVTYTYGDKPVEWRRGLYSTAEHFYLNELN